MAGLLAKRLVKHGVTFSAEALALATIQNAATATPAAALVSTTVKAAMLVAAGQTAATGLVSAQVAAITKGVLTSMLLTKLKTAATVTVIVSALGGMIGTSFLDGQTTGTDPQRSGPGTPGQPPGATKKADAPTVVFNPQENKPDDRLETLHRQMIDLAKQNVELRDAIVALKKEIDKRPPQPATKTEIRIFSLKNLGAEEVAATIMALFDHATLNGEAPRSFPAHLAECLIKWAWGANLGTWRRRNRGRLRRRTGRYARRGSWRRRSLDRWVARRDWRRPSTCPKSRGATSGKSISTPHCDDRTNADRHRARQQGRFGSHRRADWPAGSNGATAGFSGRRAEEGTDQAGQKRGACKIA